MRQILKCLLLCLLALALPLQGLAAVGTRSCAMASGLAAAEPAPAFTPPLGAHGGHGGHEAVPAPDGVTHHTHQAPHTDAGMHATAPDCAHAGDPDPAQPADGQHPGKHHTCSSCASCCAGAALPVTVHSFTGSSGPLALVPTQPATAPGWLPPHPKRPPRPIAP